VLDDNLSFYEIKQVEYLVRELDRQGVSIAKPPGGLGLYVDAKCFLPHVPLLLPFPGSSGYPARLCPQQCTSSAGSSEELARVYEKELGDF